VTAVANPMRLLAPVTSNRHCVLQRRPTFRLSVWSQLKNCRFWFVGHEVRPISLAFAEKERAVTSANEDLPLPHLLRDLALD
jgi:hypothetical protein